VQVPSSVEWRRWDSFVAQRIDVRTSDPRTVNIVEGKKGVSAPSEKGVGMGEERFDRAGAVFREPSGPHAVEEGSDGLHQRPATAGASSDSEARYEAPTNGSPTPLPVRPENAPSAIDGADADDGASAPRVGGVPSPDHGPGAEDRQGEGRSADADRPAPPLTADDERADSLPLYPSLSSELRDAYVAFPAAGPPASQAAARRAEARGTLVRLLVRYTLARSAEARDVRRAA